MSGRRHVARYTRADHGSPGDPRLHSPAFPRNGPPTIAALTRILGDRRGAVLEIGAGTGQHAAAFALAFPALDWWPSDPDPAHRASIAAWQRALGAPERPPLALDATSDWAEMPEVAALGALQAVLSMNVIHIAPLEVAEGIIRGAARALAPGGLVIFYGPFHVGGRPTGPGNARFDRDLRAENPDWGVRDVGEIAEIAARHGLSAPELVEMPADNRIVTFRR